MQVPLQRAGPLAACSGWPEAVPHGVPCLQEGAAAAWVSRPPAAGAELGHAAGVPSHGSTSPPLNTPGTQGKSSTGSRERCPRAGRARAGASTGAEVVLACRFTCWCTSAFHNRGLKGKSQELLLKAFVRNHVHSDTRSGALGFEAVTIGVLQVSIPGSLGPPCSAPNPQVSAPKSKNTSSSLQSEIPSSSVSSGGGHHRLQHPAALPAEPGGVPYPMETAAADPN